MNIRQLLRIIFRRETEHERIHRRARAAVRGARLASRELKKRPFTEAPPIDPKAISREL